MPEATRILAVDDEADILRLVTYNLRKQGYVVDEAREGEAALQLIHERPYQLVVLDLMLPGLSGMDICRIMKKDPTTAAIPIIMLTARSEEMDKVVGLDMGADDYITKPFGVREFLARVKSVLRRSGGPAQDQKQLTAGNIVLDLDRYRAASGEIVFDLSPTEFRLLQFLMERRGRVFSRDQILDAVWKGEAYVEPRTVDVHVRRLRAELEKAGVSRYIRTVRGVGYGFGDED